MTKRFFYTAIIVIIFAGLCAILLLVFSHHKNNIYVWAWERPEDLTFLENSTDTITVVYYAGDVVIQNGGMEIKLRRNKLFLPGDVSVMPLVRIDNFDNATALTEERMQAIQSFIVRICTVSGISGCQIDFDATVSERPVYAKLIAGVKKEIPINIPLSITALVSWCDTFSWLDDTVIDYAVPMFYRLGPDRDQIQNDRVGQTFMKSKKCQTTVGISTDEKIPIKKYWQGRDIYFFNPQPWTKEVFIQEIRKLNLY